MLEFTIDVTAADSESRTIEGVVVPYGETAILGGVRYSFEPGSLELARSRTPLLLGHDQARPVGILRELADRDDGVVARFAVDPTPDGDAALAQAQSGSRGGLSIGAEVDEYLELEGGTRHVSAARVFEVSLVSLPAFAGAGVELVAAELENDDQGDEPGNQGDEPDTEGDESMSDELELEAGAEPVIIRAASERRSIGAGELAVAIVGAQRGDTDSMNVVRAALTESSAANLAGVLPPQYQAEVIGGKTEPRVLYSIFGGRSLPSSGLAIIKPVWTVHPAGGWLAGNVADAPSNAAAVSTQQADVQGWAWGIAVPYMLATRSDPDVISGMYGEAVVGFHADVEALIAAELEAGAASTATTFGEAVAEFYAACRKTPDAIIVAPDVWGAMADGKVLDAPLGLGQSVQAAGGLAASFAGITIAASADLTAGAAVLATRKSIDARVTDPVKLTANAIGALNVELGVVGEALVDTDWPLELLVMATAAPAVAAARAAKK